MCFFLVQAFMDHLTLCMEKQLDTCHWLDLPNTIIALSKLM